VTNTPIERDGTLREGTLRRVDTSLSPYDAQIDRPRILLAAVALLVPSLVFALNAYISYRERNLVEPYDIPAAIAFLVAAVRAWRRVAAGLIGGAVLCAIYLASVVISGPAVFVAYWIVALVLTIQAVPLLRRPAALSA
jgi:hypothetical protein